LAAWARIAAFARRQAGFAGALPAEVARRNTSCLLDCLRAATLLEAPSVRAVEDGMRELSAWAAKVGGAAAIVERARPVPNAADAARYTRLADELE
jgi:hypothetical protein